jgi:chemotaxis protein CheX
MPDYPELDVSPRATLELPGVLDLKAAIPLTVEFLTLRGRPVNVDASQVERLGGQCLQVLLSAAEAWKTDEMSFSFVNPSSDFTEGLARLGVSTADFPGQDKSQ